MAYPITRAGPFAVPFAYTLAAGERFEAESISGVWNGTGASGSFIPCVSVYTQDGKLLGRFKGDATVSAGDSSTEATFAPFLKGIAQTGSTTAGGTPTTATFYRSASLGAGDPALNVAAGATVTIPWLHAALPSDGSITGPTTGSTRMQFNAPFICTHELHVGWDDGAYQKAAYIGTQSRLVVADDAGYPNVGAEAMGVASIDGLSWCYVHRDDGKIATDELFAYVYNGDAVAHDIWECWLSVHAWPATGYTGNVPHWPV